MNRKYEEPDQSDEEDHGDNDNRRDGFGDEDDVGGESAEQHFKGRRDDDLGDHIARSMDQVPRAEVPLDLLIPRDPFRRE